MAVASKKQDSAKGRLHIDLGRITEDVNGNGRLDTEDGIVTGLRNGLLDEGEDRGLDTIPDEREIGPDSAAYDPSLNPDPAGDNWADPVRGADYDHINGTEKNASDANHYGIPDTEDIGGPSETDYVNSYFSFNVDLDNPKSFKVDSSGLRSRDVTGYADSLEWITYRIPLWDYAARLGSSLDSNDIQFARIWMDGAGQDVRVYIAAISLVQNTWKASVDSLTARTDTLGVKRFGVAVKNTEENRDYSPPPGVGGFVDANGVREKEQSLILTYSNFRPGDSGHARLASSVAQDFTGYRQLTLFVRGNETADTNRRYYFRFGQDERNYYYYSEVLDYNRYRAESGWQSMVVDLDRATVVKEAERQRLLKSGRTDTLNVFDSTSHIGVRGLPSLSRIGYMEIGVVRGGAEGDPPDSGEVWFDELRLDGVRKDQGTAARATLTTQLADLMGFTANVTARNYAFRTLNEGRSGSLLNSASQLNTAVNGNVNLSKFIPESWGFSLPVSLSYSRDIATPKLLTGSDVVLNRTMQDSLQTRRESQSISTAIKWAPPNAPGYLKYTLCALAGNFNVSRQVGRSPNVPSDKSENYNAGATYALQFKNRGTFSPLSWTRFLLVPRSLHGTKFSVLPTTFSAGGNYARTHQTSVNSNNDTTRIDSRLFSGNAKIGLAPIPALTASWDMTTSRNLSNPRDVNLAFNPKEFQLGTEQSFRQRVSADYRPFVIPFLTHSFAYSADFSDQIENVTVTNRVGIPNGSSIPGDWGISVTSRVPSHNVQLNRQYSANGTLDVAKVWTFLGRKEVKRSSAKPARTKSDTKKSGPGKEGTKKGLEKDLESDLKGDSRLPSIQETQPSGGQPRADGPIAGSQFEDQRPPTPQEPGKSGLYGPPTPDTTRKEKTDRAHGGVFGPVIIWRRFLDGLGWITTPIAPLSVTYSHSDAITQNSLRERPGLGFQFGFATDTSQLPPVVVTSSSPGRVPTRSGSDRIDVKNSLKLGNILTIGNSYGWSMSRRQQSGSSNYTFSRSFPVLSTSFERLERITPVGWIFTNASIRTAYNHKYDEAGNGDKRSPIYWTSKSWSSGFSPLVSVSGTIHKTIRCGFSMTDTKSHSEQNQKQSRPTDAHSTTWDVNLDYSFSSPKGIPIPLLRGIRLKSQMTMSVRVSGKSNQSFIVDTSGVSRPVEQSSDLSVSPQANYSFSTRVKGGFTAQWSDSKSNGRKNHTRSLALWAEFTF
jgi:cell surface protein SprA